MKYLTLLLFASISINATAQWNDTKVASEGKEPSRTEFVSYDRRDDAVTYNRTKSPFYRSLNGEWDFKLAPTPAEIDPDFYINSRVSTKMMIPGLWSKALASDLAALKAPMLPMENPVGQYRKDVDIPIAWLDRDVYLHVAGAKSGFTLYINGQKVGYSEDASIPAEFNISQYVSDGTNKIGIELYKWTTGSWLESNTIEGAAIADGVYLYSQPKVHIDDFILRTNLDPASKTGKMELDIVVVNNFNAQESVAVYFDLMNSKGDIVRYNYQETKIGGMGERDTVKYVAYVPNASKWSTQSPNLYNLILRLRYNGRFTEYIPYKLGFHDTTAVVTLKAKDWVFSGVSMDDKTLRTTLSKIKTDGYNAIRCGYYPNKNRLYELCTEMGIYVVDLLNLDTSLTGKNLNVGGNIGNAPQWLNSFVYRAENSYAAVRNHTCLIDWSVGENVGDGYNIYKLRNKMSEINRRK